MPMGDAQIGHEVDPGARTSLGTHVSARTIIGCWRIIAGTSATGFGAV
jgi:hypothetical protein